MFKHCAVFKFRNSHAFRSMDLFALPHFGGAFAVCNGLFCKRSFYNVDNFIFRFGM